MNTKLILYNKLFDSLLRLSALPDILLAQVLPALEKEDMSITKTTITK